MRIRHLALFVLVGFCSSSLYAANVASLAEGAVQGDILGVDDRGRLMVKRTSDGVSVGIALDSIEEIDFGRPVALADPEQCAFRVVLLDGTALIGALKPGVDPDLFGLESPALGKLAELQLLDCERIERRAVTVADQLLPPSKSELGTRSEEWKVYQAEARLGGDSICDLTGINDTQARFILAGIDSAESGGAWRDWDKIRALVRKATKYDAPTTLFAIVRLSSGDLLKGEVSAWKDNQLSLKTAMAGTITIPQEQLSTVVFKNGRFVFLSDMEPSAAEEYPYIRATDFDPATYLFAYRKDRAQGGSDISLGGKRFSKGLGVHAISKLTFDANKRFSRLVATVGVDDSAGQSASVEFSVLIDGKPAELTIIEDKDGSKTTRKALSTGVLRRDSPALRIEVPVADARKVTLYVAAADHADIDDRANWANAMFVR